MRKIVSLFFVLLVSVSLLSQKRNKSYLDYIEKYKDVAIREMEEYRIPASITLAQGLLESGAGSSELALKANNHFGIKCQKNWTGETVYHDDDAKGECFRKYTEVLESYEDHSKFLKAGQRYASLFELASTDYKGWARGLKKAGYATLPTYADRLIDIIELYELTQYDKLVLKGQESTPPPVMQAKPAEAKSAPIAKPAAKPKRSFWDKLFHKNEMPDLVKDSLLAKKQKVFKDSSSIAELTAFRSHEIKKINGVKYVVALSGDTYESIAEEFEMFEKELLKANEVQYGANPSAGDIVYLAKKKKRGESASYTAQAGETVYIISQKTGVRVRSLYKLNGLVYGKQVNAGDIIKLK